MTSTVYVPVNVNNISIMLLHMGEPVSAYLKRTWRRYAFSNNTKSDVTDSITSHDSWRQRCALVWIKLSLQLTGPRAGHVLSTVGNSHVNNIHITWASESGTATYVRNQIHIIFRGSLDNAHTCPHTQLVLFLTLLYNYWKRRVSSFKTWKQM